MSRQGMSHQGMSHQGMSHQGMSHQGMSHQGQLPSTSQTAKSPPPSRTEYAGSMICMMSRVG